MIRPQHFLIKFLLIVPLLVGVTDAYGEAFIKGIGSEEALLSKADAKALASAFQAADKERWGTARRHANTLKDALARKIFLWFDLHRRDTGASFETLSAFIEDNPAWPGIADLRQRAEEKMTRQAATRSVIDWFEKFEPVSTDGWVRYAQALLDAGDTGKAKEIIRDTWVNRNFSKRPEQYFYKNYRKYLTYGDHVARLDRLLWEGKNWPVRRMLMKVKKDIRAVAQARLFLRQRYGNVDTAIARIPAALKNDPGLVYERLRWRRARGRFEGAIELLDIPLGNLVRPDLWAKERILLARRGLKKGYITEAYKLVAEHQLSEGSEYAEAEWLAGWIALRFLNQPKTALKHFVGLFDNVNFPVSQARGAYWAARAAEAMDDKQAAHMWYSIATKRPTVFYGQLAASHLNDGHGLVLPVPPEPSEQEIARFKNNKLTRAVEILYQVDELDRIKSFIMALAESETGAAWKLLTARHARNHERPDLGIRIAKRSSRDGTELIEVGYPMLVPPSLRTRSKDRPLELPLVLAMIRQESAFYTKAKSHANARGLMQILPSTAKKVAGKLRIPYSKKRLLTDPQYNMLIGQSYLAGLIDEFEGSYVLALSAYNAGPGRARNWSKINGKLNDKDVDNVDWIEMIPFNETRNYVQRVLENLQIYRLRLATAQVAETLEKDLGR